MEFLKRFAVVFLAAVLTFPVDAGQTATLVSTRSSASAAVTLGKWHAGFKKCKDYATKNGVPLIAVWSNGDSCGHCVAFESSVNSSYFKSWMKTSGCVFYFIYSGDGGDGAVGSEVFHWIRNNKNTAYPFVRIYWPKGKVDIATVGDTIDGNRDGTTGGKKAVAYFKAKLKNYTPNVVVTPKYKGGYFDADDEAGARLEAEVGYTTNVCVNLSRTNTVASAVATNKVLVVYPNGKIVTNAVNWAAGASQASVAVEIKNGMTVAGAQITLLLQDEAGKGIATNHITMVEAPENSPKNPRWIGERTSESLAWGEWTMDIDAATNKVRTYNVGKSASTHMARLQGTSVSGKAHTLLLIGGPLWCPDCKRAEEALINTSAFRDWATNEALVACVAIDEPRFAIGSNDSPTLLTEKSVAISNIVAVGKVSGASYLSRKMADLTLAKSILERNLSYVNNDTRNGGYCTPDNTAGAGNTRTWRTGIPCIVVLRDDGSVAGRLFQFSNSTSALADGTVSAEVLVQRLREIVAQDEDLAEESNDSRYTTTEIVGLRETIADRTLSFSDICDTYRLDPVKTLNQRLKAKLIPVEGKQDFLPGTRLQVKIVQADGGATKTLAASEVELGTDAELECAAEIATTNCYVVVSYPVDSDFYSQDPQFSLTNRNSTLCHYSLRTDFVAVPTETNRVIAVEGGLSILMSIQSNKLYRIVGLDPSANTGVLQRLDGTEDRYAALVTGDVELVLAQAEISFQIWNPGTVGFARQSGTVAEPKTGLKVPYSLVVSRQGGSAGMASAKVVFNAEKSSTLEGLFEEGEGFGSLLTWEEGDVAEKTVTLNILDNVFADGDQVLYFDLVRGENSSAEEGINQFKLTLRDNDKKVPGRVAIVETVPDNSSMAVFQRSGDTVEIGVGRVDGTTGKLGANIQTTLGELANFDFEWQDRNTETQYSTLTLPNGSAGKKVVVTLTPSAGVAVDSVRRKLTVNVVADEAPGFAEGRREVAAWRYLPIEEQTIALDEKALSTAKIKKHSGALPQGVSWKQVDKNLIISGVPTKAGTYKAVFRAYNGAVGGLTVTVVVVVSDPVLTGSAITGNSPLNASVAVSRTVSNIPVYDSTTNRLVGLLTLTLPRSGRASAKFRKVDGTVTLSSSNWSEIDVDTGVLTAVLKDKKNGCSLTVGVASTGALELELVDSEYESELTCDLPEVIWSAKRPATDFKGYYTVSLPQKTVLSGIVFATGDAHVTLKMNASAQINAGKFTYAGIYPTGKSFSGSATLIAKEWKETLGFWEYGVLPLFVAGEDDALTGAFKLTPGAYDLTAHDVNNVTQTCEGRCSYQDIRRSVRPYEKGQLVWRHLEKASVASAEVLWDAYGTYYTTAESFADCCNSTLGSTKLSFYAMDGLDVLSEEDLLDLGIDLRAGLADWGDNRTVGAVNVKYEKLTKNAKSKTNQLVPANSKVLSCSFTPSTGLVTGSFKVPVGGASVTMSYSGIVMPGWGSQECADCGMGGAEARMRPFVSGTAWFTDVLDYEDEKGRGRTLKIRRSCPISIGVKPGE